MDGKSFNLNDKGLVCLCLHFKELQESFKDKKPADLSIPCNKCKYNRDCNFDWLEIINTVLSEVLHERASYFCSCRLSDKNAEQSQSSQSGTKLL